MSDTEDNFFRPTAETDRELVRLWRCWRTIHELCHDRGYELADDELNMPLDDFKRLYSDNGMPNRRKMTFSARPSEAMIKKFTIPPTKARPNPPPPALGTICVEFGHEANWGIKQMRAFSHHVQQNNFHTGIIVTQSSLTNQALKVVPTVLPSILEHFLEVDLLVNITHHELVPKHILLAPDEKKALLERYRLHESQLPRIQRGDPVARYLGLQRGQVVKIIRKSETAGRYATYRWAI